MTSAGGVSSLLERLRPQKQFPEVHSYKKTQKILRIHAEVLSSVIVELVFIFLSSSSSSRFCGRENLGFECWAYGSLILPHS